MLHVYIKILHFLDKKEKIGVLMRWNIKQKHLDNSSLEECLQVGDRKTSHS